MLGQCPILGAVRGPVLRIEAQGALDFSVLGPRLIVKGGVQVEPSAARRRNVLAVLAHRPSDVVSRESIHRRSVTPITSGAAISTMGPATQVGGALRAHVPWNSGTRVGSSPVWANSREHQHTPTYRPG